MNHDARHRLQACGAVLAASVLTVLTPMTATASPATGVCTESYTALTFDQVGQLPDGPLAQQVFTVVNANGDDVVCYKPYPNGPHNGHYGNFVDNKAAPHS
jgi:hypothetical protein